jgi:heme exporter protein C
MQARSTTLNALNILSILLLAAATYMALVYAPEEAVMGQVQRVFYFHVSTGWVGMLGFLAAAVSGVAYLVTKDPKWDIVEIAAVEISLVFFLTTIILGSIWARPIWNSWWTWDPRLTTAAITELIYLAYFMLRGSIENPELRARLAAVYTLVGAVSVPITFLATRLFRTIHPVVIGGGNPDAQGGFAMTPHMLVTFLFCLFAFTVIFIDLFWNRIRMGYLAAKVEQLRLTLIH